MSMSDRMTQHRILPAQAPARRTSDILRMVPALGPSLAGQSRPSAQSMRAGRPVQRASTWGRAEAVALDRGMRAEAFVQSWPESTDVACPKAYKTVLSKGVACNAGRRFEIRKSDSPPRLKPNELQPCREALNGRSRRGASVLWCLRAALS